MFPLPTFNTQTEHLKKLIDNLNKIEKGVSAEYWKNIRIEIIKTKRLRIKNEWRISIYVIIMGVIKCEQVFALILIFF